MERFDEQAFLQRLTEPVISQNNPDGTRDVGREIRSHLANLDIASSSVKHPDDFKRAGLQRLIGVHGRAAVAEALKIDHRLKSDPRADSSTDDYLKLLETMK